MFITTNNRNVNTGITIAIFLLAVILLILSCSCSVLPIPGETGIVPTLSPVNTPTPFPPISQVNTPTPTQTPDVPTNTPIPTNNAAGVKVVVRFPVMTEENKGALNKHPLFCLTDADKINHFWVFHRYLEASVAWPGYEVPGMDWWPAWRIEAGPCGNVEEINIRGANYLPGDTAEFIVTWGSGDAVTCRHSGTGDSQRLEPCVINPPLSYVNCGDLDFCMSCGVWTGYAEIEYMEWLY